MDLDLSFMRFSISIIVVTILFYSYAVADDNVYTWQVQRNTIYPRGGHYQDGISNEEECKTRCVETSSCIAVDWQARLTSCFLHDNPTLTSRRESGSNHWRITRNASTLSTSQIVGCSDIILPEDTWLKRNDDTIQIGCYSSRQTWQLSCREGKWIGVLGNCTLTTVTVATPAADVRRIIPNETSDQNLIGLLEKSASNTDVVGDFFVWQSVQLNTRSRAADFQSGASNETSCKTRCVQKPDCIGIDWYNGEAMCFLLYDCNGSTHTEVGYSHWEIVRYTSTQITCQDVSRRAVSPSGDHQSAARFCDSQDNSSKVVKVLSVLLVVAAVVMAGLVYNTWRLRQKIHRCTCTVDTASFAKKAKENGYQSYNGAPLNQQGVYTDMVRIGDLPPIPPDTETFYAAIADIDDDPQV